MQVGLGDSPHADILTSSEPRKASGLNSEQGESEEVNSGRAGGPSSTQLTSGWNCSNKKE